MRTKKEILNDFEKLGCKIEEDKKDGFITILREKNNWTEMFEIDKGLGYIYVYSRGINFDFLPLLNELVECLKEKK